jgi:hypothetical protein
MIHCGDITTKKRDNFLLKILMERFILPKEMRKFPNNQNKNAQIRF